MEAELRIGSRGFKKSILRACFEFFSLTKEKKIEKNKEIIRKALNSVGRTVLRAKHTLWLARSTKPFESWELLARLYSCTTLNMLVNALVFPYFDYCSLVWSNCSLKFSNILQILQNKLARVLLSADIRTSVDNLLCDFNWIKLDKRWKIQPL